jgi:hypothetical protein
VMFPPNFDGEEHDTGAAWASTLWAIRESVGQQTCDALVVESLDYLDSKSTFGDARTALHAVDQRLNNDQNKDVIDEAFDARVP